MDASIMDGHSLDAGSVVCVSNVANPVHLARAVMEQVLLSCILYLIFIHILKIWYVILKWQIIMKCVFM